jgi:hypothetical protein
MKFGTIPLHLRAHALREIPPTRAIHARVVLNFFRERELPADIRRNHQRPQPAPRGEHGRRETRGASADHNDVVRVL